MNDHSVWHLAFTSLVATKDDKFIVCTGYQTKHSVVLSSIQRKRLPGPTLTAGTIQQEMGYVLFSSDILWTWAIDLYRSRERSTETFHNDRCCKLIQTIFYFIWILNTRIRDKRIVVFFGFTLFVPSHCACFLHFALVYGTKF